MLHHVDVTFEPAEHVQDMPRSLRKWVRSLLAAKISTVSAKKEANPVVEIDVKAAADASDKALARTSMDGEKRRADKEKKKGGDAGYATTSLAALKDKWNEEEQRFKQELAELQKDKLEQEEDMIASYLVMVEDRDIKREQQEAEARRKRQEEFLALQEAERAIREQELAAMRSREQQEASRLEKAKGAMDKKLDKFRKAQETARRKKLRADATEAIAALSSCIELVAMDCKSGSCRLLTAAALASPLCKLEDLERASHLIQQAQLEQEEEAQKVVALLFDLRRGLEDGEKRLREAESALARVLENSADAGREGNRCREALGQAEASLLSAGLASRDAMERVKDVRRRLEEIELKHAVKAQEEATKKEEEATKKEVEDATATGGKESMVVMDREEVVSVKEVLNEGQEEKVKEVKTSDEEMSVAVCEHRELCSGNDTTKRSRQLPDKCGVGMAVKAVKAGNEQVGLEVTRLVDGSPASESGKIAIGDRLLMVDGEEVSSVSPKILAEERIMGERGTRVTLTVMKVGGEKVFVELTRR